MKLSKPIMDQAYKVIVTRHKTENKSDLSAIYKTITRLMKSGVSERELMEVLQHDHCESKLAKREAELPWREA